MQREELPHVRTRTHTGSSEEVHVSFLGIRRRLWILSAVDDLLRFSGVHSFFGKHVRGLYEAKLVAQCCHPVAPGAHHLVEKQSHVTKEETRKNPSVQFPGLVSGLVSLMFTLNSTRKQVSPEETRKQVAAESPPTLSGGTGGKSRSSSFTSCSQSAA